MFPPSWMHRLRSRASTASFSVALDDKADATKVSDDLRTRFDSMSGIGEVKLGDDSAGLGGSKLSVDVQAADANVLAAWNVAG